MDKLELLNIKKLLRKLEWLESDYELKSETINDADSKFITSANKILESNTELKKLYDEKINKKLKISIDNKTKANKYVKSENKKENTSISISNTINKKLYRDIVKLTHPDKVGDDNLKGIYLKATESYESFDRIGLYKICDSLNIAYEFTDDDKNHLVEKIKSVKSKINLLESKFTWKWLNSKTEKEKNKILIEYIKIRLIN